MLGRILQWFQRPKPAPPTPKPTAVDCLVDKKIQRVMVLGIVGMRLQVTPDGRSVRLVGPNQFADPQVFWETWKAWGGQSLAPHWEDGTPYTPY